MLISELQPTKLTDDQLTQLLFHYKKDDGQAGECIFVPGSSKAVELRVPKAIELYKAGRAQKMLFSGGVSWDQTKKPEAVMMGERALKEGVPANDILIEDISLHTKENVLASLLVLDRAFDLHNINHMIIVTAEIHMRRVYLTMNMYMPPWITYSLCPVSDRTTKESNWFLNRYGRKRVETEATKLIDYTRRGAIADEELELI